MCKTLSKTLYIIIFIYGLIKFHSKDDWNFRVSSLHSWSIRLKIYLNERKDLSLFTFASSMNIVLWQSPFLSDNLKCSMCVHYTIRIDDTYPFSLHIFLYDMILSVFKLIFYRSHILIGFLVVCLLFPKITIEI